MASCTLPYSLSWRPPLVLPILPQCPSHQVLNISVWSTELVLPPVATGIWKSAAVHFLQWRFHLDLSVVVKCRGRHGCATNRRCVTSNPGQALLPCTDHSCVTHNGIACWTPPAHLTLDTLPRQKLSAYGKDEAASQIVMQQRQGRGERGNGTAIAVS
jgi:hypothetical protein